MNEGWRYRLHYGYHTNNHHGDDGVSSGEWMGWKQMDCIFLGVILSISSTTIILKNFDELGVKAQICRNCYWFLIVARYYCHFNDGTVINSCSK
jgi:hypothetical protein